MCQFEFCSIKPNYNFYTESVGVFCNKHKQIGMVNVKTYRQCSHYDCVKPSQSDSGYYGASPLCKFHKDERTRRLTVDTLSGFESGEETD
jgi:hypothetical protein